MGWGVETRQGQVIKDHHLDTGCLNVALQGTGRLFPPVCPRGRALVRALCRSQETLPA